MKSLNTVGIRYKEKLSAGFLIVTALVSAITNVTALCNWMPGYQNRQNNFKWIGLRNHKMIVQRIYE